MTPSPVTPVESGGPPAITAPRRLSALDGRTTVRTITPPRAAQPQPLPASLDEVRRLHHLKGQVHRLAQAIMEGLNGTRPLHQLSRWMEPPLFSSLQLRRALVQDSQDHFGRELPSPYADAHVQSVHAQCVTPRVVEATAVIRCRKRTRAVAIRMEARRASWIVTALEIG